VARLTPPCGLRLAASRSIVRRKATQEASNATTGCQPLDLRGTYGCSGHSARRRSSHDPGYIRPLVVWICRQTDSRMGTAVAGVLAMEREVRVLAPARRGRGG
jgi:hypothetical protein